jgi:hypothetical protein
MRRLIRSFGILVTACLADDPESVQAKIARAMWAGPPEIARSARIVDTDAHGKSGHLARGEPTVSRGSPDRR